MDEVEERRQFVRMWKIYTHPRREGRKDDRFMGEEKDKCN